MLTTQFHIPNHFTLNIGIMDTERVRFCTGPEVNIDFFLHSTTTWASSMVAPPLSFAGIPWKIPHFDGQKVGINNKRGNRVTENKTRF